MSKQFHAIEVKLYKQNESSIFSQQLYQIPDYQRPYVWDEEKIEKFWENIMEEKENKDKEYFMGNLLIMPSNKENSRSDIVDGQQRITTFTILFLVLRHFFDKDSQIARKINACIVDPVSIEERLILRQDSDNQNTIDAINKIKTKAELASYFENNKKTLKSSNIFTNAKKFFELATKVSENELELTDFTNYILENITLLCIKCLNEEDALKIFNTINSEGVPLSQVDIIKVKLLQKINQDRRKQFNDNWKAIIKLLDENNWEYDEMFSSYYLSFAGENLKMNLHKSFDEKFLKNKSSDESVELSQNILKSLKDYDDKYMNFVKNKYLNMLAYLPWDSYIDAIIFATFRNVSDEKTENDLLKELCQFYYLHYIAGSSVNTIKQTSFNIIKKINENKLFDIRNILNENLTKNNIVTKVKLSFNENVYGEKWIKPLLLSLEYHLTDSINGFLRADDFQIEHILPQTFEVGNVGYHFTLEECNEYLNKLGNLTILSTQGRKNAKAGNKSFQKKLDIYEGMKDGKVTNSILTQEIVKQNKNDPIWSKEKIEKRTKDLISKASELLNIKLD